MEGFLQIRLRPWMRRLLTRVVALVPAAVVAGAPSLLSVVHCSRRCTQVVDLQGAMIEHACSASNQHIIKWPRHLHLMTFYLGACVTSCMDPSSDRALKLMGITPSMLRPYPIRLYGSQATCMVLARGFQIVAVCVSRGHRDLAAGAGVMGNAGAGKLLVLSQVILSLTLSFAVFPLVHFTCSRAKMGKHVNGWTATVAACLIAVIIALLNAYLIVTSIVNNEFGTAMGV